MMDKQEMTHCRGCEAEIEMMRPIDQHWWARRDNYGIFTGIYCDDCYASGESSRYPYRKDDYHDPMYAGERLEPEDNLHWNTIARNYTINRKEINNETND